MRKFLVLLFLGLGIVMSSCFVKSNWIPLEDIFGNPQKANIQISPDNKNLLFSSRK